MRPRRHYFLWKRPLFFPASSAPWYLGDSAVPLLPFLLPPFPLSSLSKSFYFYMLYLTYLSAGLIVVQIHQADWVFGSLSALSPVLGVHKSSREGDAKVNVVRTAGPLWRVKDDEL